MVVEEDREVVAFASTSPHRARPCCAGIAEFSVYVARHRRGTGAGRVAMTALLEAEQPAIGNCYRASRSDVGKPGFDLLRAARLDLNRETVAPSSAVESGASRLLPLRKRERRNKNKYPDETLKSYFQAISSPRYFSERGDHFSLSRNSLRRAFAKMQHVATIMRKS